jgi:hypothetical protein
LVNNEAYDVLKKAIHSENTNTTSASASIYIQQSHEDSSEDDESDYEPNFDFTDTVLFDSIEISQISVHDDDEDTEIDEISEFLTNM